MREYADSESIIVEGSCSIPARRNTLQVDEHSQIISRDIMKMVALIAMAIDHVAWVFDTTGLLGTLMHFVGRITMPLMCFFIAEGFRYSSSVPKYMLRILVMAIASQYPFDMCFGSQGVIRLNVCFNLLAGLIALYVINTDSIPRIVAIASMPLLVITSYYSDWGLYGFAFILIFGLINDRQKAVTASIGVATIYILNKAIAYTSIQAYSFGVLVPLLLIAFYNSNKNNLKESKLIRYMFYIFYPLHLLILGVFKAFIK